MRTYVPKVFFVHLPTTYVRLARPLLSEKTEDPPKNIGHHSFSHS